MRWNVAVITALGRLRWEDLKFRVTLATLQDVAPKGKSQ